MAYYAQYFDAGDTLKDIETLALPHIKPTEQKKIIAKYEKILNGDKIKEMKDASELKKLLGSTTL